MTGITLHSRLDEGLQHYSTPTIIEVSVQLLSTYGRIPQRFFWQGYGINYILKGDEQSSAAAHSAARKIIHDHLLPLETSLEKLEKLGAGQVTHSFRRPQVYDIKNAFKTAAIRFSQQPVNDYAPKFRRIAQITKYIRNEGTAVAQPRIPQGAASAEKRKLFGNICDDPTGTFVVQCETLLHAYDTTAKLLAAMKRAGLR